MRLTLLSVILELSTIAVAGPVPQSGHDLLVPFSAPYIKPRENVDVDIADGFKKREDIDIADGFKRREENIDIADGFKKRQEDIDIADGFRL
ncbi:hypothetical protein VSDG_03392 [Cytospora chrysosperma]|uniref:Uncharacterized protein n=1 Tax=Cytospora chrysosperma TaxID=252740 RepID=A0A423WB30_CYTCH|nr:hypothetical protein VSDG_03392 [Valsa sordida]